MQNEQFIASEMKRILSKGSLPESEKKLIIEAILYALNNYKPTN